MPEMADTFAEVLGKLAFVISFGFVVEKADAVFFAVSIIFFNFFWGILGLRGT
jgi:hypothetical protein